MVGAEQFESKRYVEPVPLEVNKIPLNELKKGDHEGAWIPDIPGDGENNASLSVYFGGGVSLQITNNEEGVILPVPGMLFKSYRDEGKFPHIPFLLEVLIPAFSNDREGQISVAHSRSEIGEIPFDAGVLKDLKIETNNEPTKPKLFVGNIKNDPERRGSIDNNSMDIEISHDGDVTVKISEIKPTFDRNNRVLMQEKREASILFKTEENGGKHPIMADVFTRIAKGFLNAKMMS